MRNIIKKTPLSIYSQPTQKKTQGFDSNDIYVSTNKAIIIIKTQNEQVSKAAKNPNKSTTQKQKQQQQQIFQSKLVLAFRFPTMCNPPCKKPKSVI